MSGGMEALRIVSPLFAMLGGGKDGKRDKKAASYKRGGKVKKSKRGGRKVKGR